MIFALERRLNHNIAYGNQRRIVDGAIQICVERKEPLTDEDRAIWEWQIATADLGEAGQERLKGASVLVSRCGGLGSVVAYELAAAGVGTLVLAHAGNLQPSDLNRQLLMTHDWLGKPRIESVRRRLLDLNPRLNLVTYNANISEENVDEMSCPSRFGRRLRTAVRRTLCDESSSLRARQTDRRVRDV